MMWGVFIDGRIVHVVPVAKDETVMDPHKLEMSCACKPRLDKNGKTDIIIHEQIN